MARPPFAAGAGAGVTGLAPRIVMGDAPAMDTGNAPRPSLVTVCHLIYGLHALSLLVGITSAVTIVGAFVFGIPSIVAVVVNYVYQADVRGSFLESHFRWQIRTFWFALLWILVGLALFLVLIGFLVSWAIFLGAGIWVIYRVARGWLTLQDRRPLQF
jgi:uncharacterized membrane protein